MKNLAWTLAGILALATGAAALAESQDETHESATAEKNEHHGNPIANAHSKKGSKDADGDKRGTEEKHESAKAEANEHHRNPEATEAKGDDDTDERADSREQRKEARQDRREQRESARKNK